MTRSELSVHSPRVVRKAFRAQANSAGLTYRAAIAATKKREEEEGKKVEKPVGIIRRNPGRMDGVQWNGDSFVCARQVDGDGFRPSEAGTWDQEEHDTSADDRRPPTEPIVVSLLDIARPAKRRGVAKKYVVLPTIRRVMDLEDDTQSEQWEQWEAGSDAWDVQSEQWETQSEQWEIPGGDYGAEEWEELYGEKSEQATRSYSSALRADER
ncbi:hypothetical protein C8F04DRAFT_1092001 [Mycena alexandri]|uniref:Uncharacterized protein n=1 Tax=Mycena alexandri TaxID=1745969 RepID=A0AAD6X6V3_9AGAR|nr:hypothetical protein C8F04DRAFT_1092001 [Mycena alexandri]